MSLNPVGVTSIAVGKINRCWYAYMIDVTPLGNLIFISSAVSTGILKNTQANKPYWTQEGFSVYKVCVKIRQKIII